MKHTRSTFNLLFYINTSKKKKSGKCPIVGRISIDGENTTFSTGLEILPAEWSASSGLAIGKEHLSINKQIENYKTDIEKHYKTMLENKGFVSAEMLKNAIRGIGTHQNTLLQEFSEFLEEKQKSISIKCAESSYRLYRDGYRHLQQFLKNKLGVDDISFGKVTISLVEDYAYYLKIDLKMKAFSVRTYLKPFRTTVRRAFNKGLLRQDPFFEFTQEKIISKPRFLSVDEIERLMNAEFSQVSTTLN